MTKIKTTRVVVDHAIYVTLRLAGHSADKAYEIALDHARGDVYARQWVEVIMATAASTHVARADMD